MGAPQLSFTNLRGGEAVASLIRKTEPKPLRVFMQDGDHDLNIFAGSWWTANQDVFSALQYSGYESKFVTGTESHNAKQGGAVLPDALRWLWQDYPKPIHKPTPPYQKIENRDILDPASNWQLVGQNYKFTEGPASDKNGNIYFCDVTGNHIYKVSAEGQVSIFKQDGGGASGLMFGADGKLYAAEDGKQKIVSWSTTDGSEEVLAEGVHSNDLAVSSKGVIYFTDPPGRRVWMIDKTGAKKVVFENMRFPNGVRFSPDESLLLVADSWTRWVWSFQVQADGTLANGEPFYRLEIPETGDTGQVTSWADGLALDKQGFLYVATRGGIQVCDPAGRVVMIIPTPGSSSPSNLVFGGPDMQTLYVTIVDKVYKRHLARQGFHPWEPLMPPKPGL
jgi:gluconolactonase